MRYRVKSYSALPTQQNSVYYVQFQFSIPSSANRADTDAWKAYAKESARLIIDETAGVVFVSSMQKGNISQVGTPTPTTLVFNVSLPTGAEVTSYTSMSSLTYTLNGKSYTITSSDKFTIEMDWGEKPEDTKADVSALAKQGSDPSVNITDMDAKLGDVEDALDYMEQHTFPSLDTIAKQGSNANADISTIQAKIGTPASGQPSTLFGAIAAGGGGGDAQESTSQEILGRIGSAGGGQSATLFGAVGDIALSATTLQSLADSWAAMVTNRNSVAGWTFSSGTEINGAGDLIARLDQLVSIDDNYVTQISSANVVSLAPMLTSIKFNEATTITSIYFGKGTIISSAIFPKLDTIATTGGYFFQNSSYLTTLQLPLLKYINGAYFLSGCSAITSVSLPEVEVMASNGLSSMTAVEEISIPKLKQLTQVFQTCQSLKSLDLSGLTGQVSGHYNALSGCPNLIKVITGSNLQSNMALANWNPTNALSSSSTSLVEQGESFTSNLEKFLYNIRTYIAANLPDRTGMTGLTFTFNAAVKAAINADTATANAFTNKNWTIA